MNMSLSLDEYQSKLINKILPAGSQEEVQRFCNAAIRGLERYRVNGHIILRFAEKTIHELQLFNPMNKNAQQWGNIQMSRIQFNRIKQRLSASVN